MQMVSESGASHISSIFQSLHCGLGAVSATVTTSLDDAPNMGLVSAEEAENFGGDGVEVHRSNQELIEEQEVEDFKSSVAKVCCCMFMQQSCDAN